MAGAGYKLFNTGDVLLASEVNTYLQQQTVMVFASSAARTTALSGVLAEGMMSYLQDTNSVEVYNGSSWVNVGNAGDITGVTAGTGISGGGSSGDVTITNSMATAIDAKGDLIVGTGADTFSRLAVGTNGHTLVADSATATGLKWAAPAGGATFAGVWAYGATNMTNGATTYANALTQEVYDTDGYHDNSTNNSRITIPAGKGGYYQVNIIATIDNASATPGYYNVFMRKNGSGTFGIADGAQVRANNPANGSNAIINASAVVSAVATDYFEIMVRTDNGSGTANSTVSFMMNLIGV